MRRCLNCKRPIPQGQTGLCIGGDPNIALCEYCAQKELGRQSAEPPVPFDPLCPGVFVGQHIDETLLELLYWQTQLLRSELIGQDNQGKYWQIARYGGTITLSRFEYYRDGAKYYCAHGRNGPLNCLAKMLQEVQIQRETLRWFPSYWDASEYASNSLPARRIFTIAPGNCGLWGPVQQVQQISDGVFWVETAQQCGVILTIHRAGRCLSQALLAQGVWSGWWYYYEQSLCLQLLVEQPGWKLPSLALQEGEADTGKQQYSSIL